MKVEECVTRDEVFSGGTAKADLWDSIIVSADIKERLFRSAVLGMQLRGKLAFATTALHGLILLVGPPGTGKTSLAQGLPAKLAPLCKTVRLIEVNPHGLMSAEHGQSQQAVMKLLADYVPGLADDGRPTILLLDEIESMAVARSAASLSANPADVHRATIAVSTALDQLTATCPHIITVATSNFPEVLDEAFTSRADDIIEVPKPDPAAIESIINVTLGGFAVAYPPLGKLASDPGLSKVATSLKGLDGRQVRKVITDAMKIRHETTVDPGKLTIDDLRQAAKKRQEGQRGAA
jgi:SpoVK/Ycf46/Vps4 family AAA+-type ATPase